MKKKVLLKESVPQAGKETVIQSVDSRTQQGKRTATPTKQFAKALADEIVKNLSSLTKWRSTSSTGLTASPSGDGQADASVIGPDGILVDTSVLIDGRIVPIVNSGFFSGTLIIPQFVLGEVQHIADSADALRRAKGRRGLDVAAKLKEQTANPAVVTMIIGDDALDTKEVDHKLLKLAARWKSRLLTLDFNLAQIARTQGCKVLNINDLCQALKVAVMPGEDLTIKITHEGKERNQGVGYLSDGTMVVVEDTRDRVGQEVTALITKVHQTPAGQLFFARPKAS